MSLTRKNGFSLIEILAGIVITSIVAFGLAGVVQGWSTFQQKQNLFTSLNDIRENVQNAVNSDAAWAKTISLNPATMGCLSSGGCAGVGSKPFNLYDANGANIIYKGLVGYDGFTPSGAPCASSPGAPCAIKLQLVWLPQCDTTGLDPNCVAPFIQISGTYSAPNISSVNWSYYNFTLMRQSITTSPCTGSPIACAASQISACLSTGWGCVTPGCSPQLLTWTVATKTCSGTSTPTHAGAVSSPINSVGPNAGSASFVCDASGSGSFSALPVAGATCSAPALASCLPQAVTWTVGPDVCVGTSVTTSSGSSTPPINSTNANSGTAIFICSALGTGLLLPTPLASATCSASIGPPPGPPRPATYVSNVFGCDWGTDKWFVYTSATIGILHIQGAASCLTDYKITTPYMWNGSAWVPSGPTTTIGGTVKSPCSAPC